jgi:hypothetical protein
VASRLHVERHLCRGKLPGVFSRVDGGKTWKRERPPSGVGGLEAVDCVGRSGSPCVAIANRIVLMRREGSWQVASEVAVRLRDLSCSEAFGVLGRQRDSATVPGHPGIAPVWLFADGLDAVRRHASMVRISDPDVVRHDANEVRPRIPAGRRPHRGVASTRRRRKEPHPVRRARAVGFTDADSWNRALYAPTGRGFVIERNAARALAARAPGRAVEGCSDEGMNPLPRAERRCYIPIPLRHAVPGV